MNRSLFLDHPSKFVIRYKEPLPKQSKPLNISSDQVLPKPHKKRNRLLYSEINTNRKSVEKEKVSYSVHTNVDEKKDQRQYSRVPIEYMDQRDHGNMADRVRGRVVYRGYIPRNTYYYFKTIKDIKYSTTAKEKDYRGQDLVFNSKFQSGNLNAAVRMSNRQYWLYMREDTNTHGLRQWYFFEVRSRKSAKYKFRIYKFTKRFSLYRLGMKPYVRTVTNEWRQAGEKVVYEYDSQAKCYYLQFQYDFEEHKDVYFAALPPYTYGNLTEWIENIAVEESVHVRKIGLSLGGLDLNAIVINDRKKKKKQKQKDENQDNLKDSNGEGQEKNHKHKEAIIVLTRTHPGETVSNWALQNFVSKVLDTSILTQNYIFFIVPMVNPDGVFLGNHRTGVLGQDLNRNFNTKDIQYFPQIQAVQNLVIQVNKKYKIAFLFDLHGHSAKKNIFAFGQECQIGSDRYLYGRIIPKMLADRLSSFKYDHCLFKASKEKTNTARVYFSNKYGINAITFEQSYGLLEDGAIGVQNWRNFGTAIAEVLVDYLNFGKEGRTEKVKKYLQGLAIEERQAIVRRKQKQLLRLKEQERSRQIEREKQLQKQKQLQKDVIYPSKTEGAYEQNNPQPKFLTEMMLRKMKLKTPRNLTNIEQELQPIRSISEEKQLEQEQELSSGDEEMEMKNAQLQVIKKDIFKIGVINREFTKRELYSMAEKKVELNHDFIEFSSRLHHKQNSAVQRIYKFKSRQRSSRQPQHSHNRSYFKGGSSIELPSIRKP